MAHPLIVGASDRAPHFTQRARMFENGGNVETGTGPADMAGVHRGVARVRCQ